MSEECCETCRFWCGDIKTDELRECVRFPPIAVDKEFGAIWPYTWITQWCGEWQAAKRERQGHFTATASHRFIEAMRKVRDGAQLCSSDLSEAGIRLNVREMRAIVIAMRECGVTPESMAYLSADDWGRLPIKNFGPSSQATLAAKLHNFRATKPPAAEP